MAQTQANDVKPSLGEITRETPAMDVNFEETIVQRLGDGVLLQFYLQDDGRMHEVTLKPIPSFCADIDRLLEVVKIAASQQDPDILFRMEKRTDGVQLHLLVTLRTALGIDQRTLTECVSIVDEERSMWHRLSREVRGLREENAALKSRLEYQESRLEHLENTHVVFAIYNATRPVGQMHLCFSTQLMCDVLYVPIKNHTTYFPDVMDNVHAKTVHLVHDNLQDGLYVQHQQSRVEGHALFRNKHACELILEATSGCKDAGYNSSGTEKCWAWVQKVLGNFPKCKVVYIIVAGSHPPEDAIKEIAHLKFVFRAKWREGCPDPWRGVAERSKNVSIEYIDRE